MVSCACNADLGLRMISGGFVGAAAIHAADNPLVARPLQVRKHVDSPREGHTQPSEHREIVLEIAVVMVVVRILQIAFEIAFEIALEKLSTAKVNGKMTCLINRDAAL